MTREQAIHSMITHGFKVEQVGEIIKAVTPQEQQTFKWCTDCKEYDQEKHCCHRWSKVIRDTVEEMKQEQEPRKGHWIVQPSNKEQGERDFIWWKCSECGQVIFSETEHDRLEFHAFCGRCGAKMVEPQESEGKE